MNWVDLVIIAVLIFFTFEGLGRSFIGETLDFFSFLAALVLSLRFYNQLAALLQSQFNLAHSLANVLGFFLVWSIVEIILDASTVDHIRGTSITAARSWPNESSEIGVCEASAINFRYSFMAFGRAEYPLSTMTASCSGV